MSKVTIAFGEDLNKHDKMTYGEHGLMYRKELAPGTVMWATWKAQHVADPNVPDGPLVEREHRCLWYVCPCGCGNLGQLPIVTKDDPNGWQWDGNLEKPTTSPSIQKLVSCNWHGYLTRGEFVQV